MSHKKNVRQHCNDYLQSRQLSHCFNETEFIRIYRQSTPKGNPYTIGLAAADSMILNAKPVTNDTGNDN